jgi:hypothetical protein
VTFFQPELPGLPIPNRAEPRLLWHYTSVASLDAIVRSHTWRASASATMNDVEELITGRRRIEQAVEHYSARNGPIPEGLQETIDSAVADAFERGAYLVSFSRADDDNSQWERYAGIDGVSIGWRRWHYPVLYDRPQEFTSMVDERIAQYPLAWVRCAYTERKQIAVARAAVSAAAAISSFGNAPGSFFQDWQRSNVHAEAVLTRAIFAIKNVGFRSERETRYIVGDPPLPALTLTGPSGRKYVELTGGARRLSTPSGSSIHSSRTSSPLPIAYVRVGPAVTSRVVDDIRALLFADYPDVRVLRSQSTLRV